MSSGLPINTFSQAREYRNRYLANLALEVQNDMMNLSANQVFRQTGQPSRPPDTRTTTEKLADLEGLKVSVKSGLLGITDGSQASETIDQLTPDEVIFTSQQLPAIIADLKPRFARGVPSNALLNYIRALRRKELQTNGVSFTAQESTAQQILNALQAGINVNGGFTGPIPGGFGNPINPLPPGPGGMPPMEPPMEPPRGLPFPPRGLPLPPRGPPSSIELADVFPTDSKSEDELLLQQNMMRRQAELRRKAEEYLKSGREPFASLSKELQDEVNKIRAERGEMGSAGLALIIGRFKKDENAKLAARTDAGLETLEQWEAFPVPGGFQPDYPDSDDIAKEFLKMWGKSQTPEIQALFAKNWDRKKTVSAMKTALFPGWQMKQAVTGEPVSEMAVDVFSEESFEMPATPRSYEEVLTEQKPPPSSGKRPRNPASEQGALGEQRGITNSIMFQAQMDSGRFSDEELAEMVTVFLEQNKVSPYTLRDFVNNRSVMPREISYNMTGKKPAGKTPVEDTNLLEIIAAIRGRGLNGPKSNVIRRPMEPASRYPIGRAILGYGLSRGKSSGAKISEFVGMPMAELSYSPFGKFIVNTNKLASNILDVRSQKGNSIPKYKQHQMSPHLAKTMKRIMGGRMIDEYDFNEMPLEDQTYLWNLAKDAKIMDRLNLPTPKRTKDGEEENRFEILKGQVMAGNDSKELIKEFKVMLVKFSNDGRIKKNEAREILLDLASMGY